MARSPSPGSDPLRAFLWGKRQSCRHPLALDVSVRGALKGVPAMSVDLSATGLLLRVPVSSLEPDAAGGDVDPFVLAETHFRGPCLAQFKRRRVKAHVELVRLDYRPDQPEYLFLGFVFNRALTSKQLKRLGLTDANVGPEAHGRPSDMVSLRAADDPVVCCILDEADPSNAMFEGRVLGIGPKSICVQLAESDVGLVAGRMREAKARIEVLEGDQVAWASGASLQAIGFAEDPEHGLELGLVLQKTPSRALARRFRTVKSE